MNDLVRLGFGVALLVLTLGLAMSYLSEPMAIARKMGVFRVGRWMVKAGWQGGVGLVRVLTKTRRPRIRRPAGPSSMRRVR